MTEICNDGKIVVLRAPGWGLTALLIGTALKLDFQQTMRERVLPNRKMNQTRRCFFLYDEYQEYVTCGGKLEGDENFFALSRQSKTINIVATQSYESLFQKIKDESSLAVLLQSLRNKVFLNNGDSRTDEYLAMLCQRHATTGPLDAILRPFGYTRSTNTFTLKTHLNTDYVEAFVVKGVNHHGILSLHKTRLRPLFLDQKEVEANKAHWIENRAILKIRDDEERLLTLGEIIREHSNGSTP